MIEGGIVLGKLFNHFFKDNIKRQQDLTIDYERAVILDAENLAEQGIAEAYQKMLPQLAQFITNAARVEDVIDEEKPSYSVRAGDQEFMIYSADAPSTEQESWGRATYFFFRIINDQLVETPIRFYALNGGNDLNGIFLTPSEAAAAQNTISRKEDWPYIPELTAPWYGQYH